MSLKEIAELQQRKWDQERMASWLGKDGPDVRSYYIPPRGIEVPYESMTDDELRDMLNWHPIKPVSRACLLAAAKNRYPIGTVRILEDVKGGVPE